MEVKAEAACFACGTANPRSLQLEFRAAAAGTVTAIWTAGEWYQGYPGMVHGGIICTLLDEGMAKAVQRLGIRGVTAKLEVRFRKPVPSGAELVITAWIEEQRGKKIKTRGAIRDRTGQLLAEGQALFIARGKT